MNYRHLLTRVEHAGVYHMPLDGENALAEAAEHNGFVVFRTDLAKAGTKAELLETLGRTMHFPEWYGHNWDALMDCLMDLGWRPAEGYVLILEHCDGIYGRAEEDFAQALQVLEEAANEWREQGLAFWCFVDMQADGLNWLSDIA